MSVRGGAEIARMTGLTRARVTQITNLTMLAADIQEQILTSGRAGTVHAERAFRPLTEEPDWDLQRRTVLPLPVSTD